MRHSCLLFSLSVISFVMCTGTREPVFVSFCANLMSSLCTTALARSAITVVHYSICAEIHLGEADRNGVKVLSHQIRLA